MPRVLKSGRVAVSGRVAIPTKENLILDSENMGSANWASGLTTVVTGQSDPFGGTGAVQIVEAAGSGTHVRRTAATYAFKNGVLYTLSTYLKAGSSPYGGLYIDAGATVSAVWNLSTGARTQFSSSNTALEAILTRETSLGSGWYRVEMCVRSRVNTGVFLQVCGSSNGTAVSYAGNTAQNFYSTATQFCRGNRAGLRATTTSSTVVGPIRNKAYQRSLVS